MTRKVSSHRKPRWRWLLAIDGSLEANRAAEYAARWATTLGVADVEILNVQPMGSFRAYSLNRSECLLEAESQSAHATAYARRVLDDAGVRNHLHTELGEAADTIVRIAHEENADEILLGARGIGAFEQLVLGSVAYKVAHLADMPVTVVSNPHHELRLPAQDASGVHRVLVPFDGSDDALRAVDYVCRLRGTRTRLDVRLVNVQLPVTSDDAAQFSSQEVIDSRYRKLGEATLRKAATSFRRAGIAFESRVLAGHLAQTIVRLSELERCTRIVMGTRGAGMIESVLLGSVAHKVLQMASIPVTLARRSADAA